MKQKCFNNYLFKSINEKQNSTIVIENFEWKNLVDDTKLGRILARSFLWVDFQNSTTIFIRYYLVMTCIKGEVCVSHDSVCT